LESKSAKKRAGNADQERQTNSFLPSDFNEPNLSRHLAPVDHLKEIARRRGGSAGEVALASDNAQSGGDRGYRRRTQRSPGGRRKRAGELRLTDKAVHEIEHFASTERAA